MTDNFASLNEGDSIKVCSLTNKDIKICTNEIVKETSTTEITVGMVVDSYRNFKFDKNGESLDVHEYWLED